MSTFIRNALSALVITALIVATVFYAVYYLNQERIEELKSIEAQLTTDTLSIETQFALLSEASCENISASTILSHELGGIGDRLAVTEASLGIDHPEVIQLKERYTLLQIRDYLLTKRIAKECGLSPVIALYFYSNAGDCSECDRAGYALSFLRQQYPSLRVYSFDYHIDLSALRTLIAVEGIKEEFPAFTIQGKDSYGFTSLDELTKLLPTKLLESQATSTPVNAN